MNIQYISIILPILIATSALNQVFAANPTPVSNVIVNGSFNQQVNRVRPDVSVLEDNNYHYTFKGKPIHLQRIKDRYTITYKNSSFLHSPRFKQQRYFREASFRKMKTAGRSLEVITINRKHIDRKSSPEILSELQSEIYGDPAVLYTAPVYYEPQSGEEVILTDKIVVKIQDNNYSEIISTISPLINVTFEKELMPQVLIFKCNNLSDRDALERCMIIETIPNIVWVQPEIIMKIEKCFIPDDPLFGKQWHLQNTGKSGSTIGADMKVSTAWDIQQMADTNITIAVLDQGIDLTHPDLRFSPGRNFFDTTKSPSASNVSDNHGTAVAGIAAAIGDNGIGVAGVAAGAKIMPIKILDDSTNLTDADIASAIDWAWRNGADVLNNSWGTNTSAPSSIINDAIIEATRFGRNGKGCPVFFSSGNNGGFFTTHKIPFGFDGSIYIGFRYKKDASDVGGNDKVYIDNVYVLNSAKDSVNYLETFSGPSLPTGWLTYGGNNGSDVHDDAIQGWSQSSVRYQQGFSAERSSFCSGTISDNQWTELRMPLHSFSTGEELYFNLNMSTEEGCDSLVLVFYTSDGTPFLFYGIGSGITESPYPYVAYPARMDSSIAVGSSTDLDFRSDYSQYDTTGIDGTVDFVAPSNGGFFGTSTTDRIDSNGYDGSDYTTNFGGTSSACPAASGLAALILSKNPHLSRNKVLEVMRSTCDKIGEVTYTGGIHKEYGYGRLNSRRAVENLPPVITGQNPLAINMNGSLLISINDLSIFDAETPYGPFSLTIHNGSNFTISGAQITPELNFTGSLRVPTSINDGIYESDICTLTVNVRSFNSAPTITSQLPVTMLEDRRYRITSDNLVITDSDDPSGPFLITATSGSNYTIVRDSIVPSPNFNGTLTVPVTASDGFASSVAFNVTVIVTAVNDAPSFNAGPDIEVSNASGPYSQVWATEISTGPADESSQTVSFSVSSTNPGLFDAVPSISSDGVLSFSPLNSVTGSSTVTVVCMDNAGTANGGNNRTSSHQFTITTTIEYSPPSFTSGPDLQVSEDAGQQTFSAWAKDINPGSLGEINQTLSFFTSNNNSSLFTVQPYIRVDGTLIFTSAPDRFGIAQVTARLHSEGDGIDSSIAHIFIITINNVNDLPSFSTGGDQTVLEDAGPQTVPAWANTISAGSYESDELRFHMTTSNSGLFLNPPAISSTGTLSYTPAQNANGIANVRARIFDGVDSGTVASFSITITAVNDAPSFIKGPDISIEERSTPYYVPTWATSINLGPSDESTQQPIFNVLSTNLVLFTSPPTVTESGALSFTPASGQTGTSTVTVTLSDDGGTDNGGINSSPSQQFSITITPANIPPSFTKGSDITVSEDTGSISISSWATEITRGAPGESDQILNFTLSNDNNVLFTAQPQISDNGTLTFITAPNRFGTARVIARLHDDGGGNDSSDADTFTINIFNVNDPPSFTAGISQQIFEDASAQNVPLWASSINSGLYENDSVYFSCITDHPEYFSIQPSINRNGDLSYTLLANAYGIATVYAFLHDTIDSCSSPPFTITILGINDPPSFNPGPNIIVNEDEGNKSFPNWANSISAGPEETMQTYTFLTTVSNPSLFSQQPSVSTTGTLTFTTAENVSGTSQVRISLRDSGGTANGGIDSSMDTTFLITITPVNDQPILSVSGLFEMTSGTQSAITITATDPDGNIPSIVISENPSFCLTVNSAGSVVITCFPSVTDTGIFHFKVSASDGELSTDTTISIHVLAPPPGRILIRDVSSNAITRLNATSGWPGVPVLTGSGQISSLKNGTYSLAISDNGYRTLYYYGTIADGCIDTITFSQHTATPGMFSSALPLQTASGPLNAGGLVSVIIDDADNDKKRDIVYTGTDGKIYMCKGDGISFSAPTLIYSGFSGRNTLRCMDWNNDGVNDLILFNVNGTVWLCRGNENGQLQNDTVLFTMNTIGCTGMDIVQQVNGSIAFYTGFSNGTIQYLTLANDGSQQISVVRDRNGQPIDVGNDADVSVFDVSGDGKMELIAGNSIGIVRVFTLKSTDTAAGSFIFATGGIPTGQNGRVSLSSSIGSDSSLSVIVFSDNSGAIYRSTSEVRGDITGDGRVDVLDLQQLGIHWGKRSTEVGWTPSVNLSTSDPAAGPQMINVLDLQVLGNSWGLRK